jgi:hypothetical protein
MPPLRTRLRVHADETVKTFALFSARPVLRLGQALRGESRPEWYTDSINLTPYYAMPVVRLVKLAIALAGAYGAGQLWGEVAGTATQGRTRCA